MCEALGFEPRDNEDLDAAMDRARSNLLVTRSRIKTSVRAFPVGAPTEPVLDED